jgi:hypothetical protein
MKRILAGALIKPYQDKVHCLIWLGPTDEGIHYYAVYDSHSPSIGKFSGKARKNCSRCGMYLELPDNTDDPEATK